MDSDLLLKRTDERFKLFIGRRVEVKRMGERHVGVLQFAGINNLHGMFQVTLSGTPLWPVKPESIKLINPRK